MSDSDALNVLPVGEAQGAQGDRCRSLLCKGMYLNYGLADDKRVTGDGNFWCGKTQTIFGPDKQFVGDGECRHTGRSCYEQH